MSLNVIDIIIVIMIILSGILGLKRGVFKQLVIIVGFILVVIFAYKFKNVVGDFLVLNIPFIKFSGFLKNVSVINIVIYQSISFIVMLCLLMMLYKGIIAVTGIFEKLLRATIILGIPSRILGFILGIIEGYVIVYIALFFISQPCFNFSFVNESQYKNDILTKTPIISKYTNDSLEILSNIYSLKDVKDSDELNYKILDEILDKKVTSVKTVEKLIANKKINFKNMDQIVNKYKEGL